MKKKIALILLTAVLILGISAGCTDQEENLSAMKADALGEAVDVISIGEIEEELGVAILVPATVTDETCQVIGGSKGVISFAAGAAAFEYYVAAGEEALDATGLAAGLPNQETILVDNATYQIAYEAGGVGIAWWHDKTNGVACTLVLQRTEDPALLKSMTESFLAVQK